MKKTFLRINILCYLLIGGFLLTTLGTSLCSGYPWAVACYNCLMCRHACPLGIDPHGFITAAITNDPDLMVEASNIRLSLTEALEKDPAMLIRGKGGEILTATEALAKGMDKAEEITVYQMKIRHAAQYCPLCGNCDKACPIDLPIYKLIEDLRDDGQFNR